MTTEHLTRRSPGAAALALSLPRLARAAGRVRIGYQKNGAMVIVRQQRRLDPLGLAVEWVEFTSGPPLLEAIIVRQQAIADTFAALRVIPARVDVRAAVWRPERPRAEARP